MSVAELLTSHTLLLGPPTDAAARATWAGSLSGAGRDALVPLVSSPALAGLVLWAALAAVLPLFVRGRSLALDAAGAAAWAAVLVGGHAALAGAASGELAHGAVRGLVPGAILGAVIAAAASASGVLRRQPGAAATADHVPTMAR